MSTTAKQKKRKKKEKRKCVLFTDIFHKRFDNDTDKNTRKKKEREKTKLEHINKQAAYGIWMNDTSNK